MRVEYPGSAVVTACLIALSGCQDMGTAPSSTPPSSSGTISFQQRVLPILTRYGCVGCHGGTNGLTVSTVADLLHGGIHGAAVVPGDAEGSLIIKKTSATPPFGDRMPQGGPYLPDTTRQVIKDWITQGAKDN
jgi:hypothetical protein